ncbi:MAG TPA: phosphopantetheine-binding protein, partial [Thermoguttaceae bacterium]|nr:phosphopantetheine-binding protein [Thermoguttaceae bacterium]
LPPQDVSRETTFAGDLRADPQQRDVLRKDLDEYLNVSIPAEAFENLRTVGEAIDLVAPLVVEARVIEIVAQRVRVAAEQITRDTSLVEDLKVSSTQRVWLRQELLKEYGIHIAWEEFKSLQTVGEVIDSVAKALVKPSAAEPGSQQPELPSPATKGIRPDRIPVTDGARPDL